MAKYYASLVGPLLGLYFPLPFEEKDLNRRALRSSKLKHLWCAIYSRVEVEQHIRMYGGQILADRFIDQLDYVPSGADVE